MNKIDGRVWAYIRGQRRPQYVIADDIRRDIGRGHDVQTFQELVSKTAQLCFRNRKWYLLYRGQGADYHTQRGTVSLYPAIYRDEPGKTLLHAQTQRVRFLTLSQKVDILLSGYTSHFRSQTREFNRVRKHAELPWAILQHYERAATPYLDFSASLRVAASFATERTTSGFIYVIAVPYPSGTITHVVDVDVKLVRLQSACPPNAKRPHFQEGYMLGSCYVDSLENRANQNASRRLITKFHIPRKRTFWTHGVYDPIPSNALYPTPDVDFSWI